ncbi:hypothetical protein L226DRAFT_273412 [Lentinus tigrinus ALCF2SS1-7]|uniref:Uncharacterized protein n=1 Tax=Lentinus tigrinus ALCF2SS1-6 TaxID=1328759 RepID=A0A5C2SB04_9APHY|nr:hypothetical protein L227DRAFT_98631 [Lentinus tigrinus ALCF2SS1-6]RPD69583.1 hypothetical protein L226DRAFT_273412 [Lentinus tigrinus ALCF2SS1-7]
MHRVSCIVGVGARDSRLETRDGHALRMQAARNLLSLFSAALFASPSVCWRVSVSARWWAEGVAKPQNYRL